MKKSVLHRLIIISLVWVLSVAVAAGQDAYKAFRGSEHEYNIAKTAFAVSYTWQIFTDLTLVVPAISPFQAELIPLGTGRENEIQVNWNSTGEYYLLVTVKSAGCENRKAWHFVVEQEENLPVARIAGAPDLTVGSCIGTSLDASASTGEGLTYSWSPSDCLDGLESSNPVFRPGQTTRYILTVTDSRGRTDKDSVLVTVADAPQIITDQSIFVKAPNEAVLLNASNSTGTGITYSWWSEEGIILKGEPRSTAQVSGLGKYYVSVTDQYGCTDMDSVQINLYIQAVRDTAHTLVDVAVDIDVLANDISINGLDPNTLSIVDAPLNGYLTFVGESQISYTPDQYYVGSDEFVYKICDQASYCDQATVLVLVNDFPVFIPDAFSPNGDGLNDEFEMIGIRGYKNVGLVIFNRWGNIVYESKNYGGGLEQDGFWNGMVRSGLGITSGLVSSGTYFYVLTLNAQNNINGSIYLDR